MQLSYGSTSEGIVKGEGRKVKRQRDAHRRLFSMNRIKIGT